MLRVVAAVEALVVASHQPQEVGLVAGGGDGGVVAVGCLKFLPCDPLFEAQKDIGLFGHILTGAQNIPA